jgi:hypothetical protein
LKPTTSIQSGARSFTTSGMKEKEMNIDSEMRMKKVRTRRIRNYDRLVAEL